MSFVLPAYHEPDFTDPKLRQAPDATTARVIKDGVAPEGFHSTSMYPEYFKLGGKWVLAQESRMDSSVVVCPDGSLDVVENRNLKAGQKIVIGRTEDGSEGILVHTKGFSSGEDDEDAGEFVFRQGRSRETSFARDYDELMELLDPDETKLNSLENDLKKIKKECNTGTDEFL